MKTIESILEKHGVVADVDYEVIAQGIKNILISKRNDIIKSVEKGWGEGSTFFSVDSKVAEFCRVDEIKEEGKQVSSDLMINVFRGYKGGKLIFEMGASIDVTVAFLA